MAHVTKDQHDQARRELGFPNKQLRVDPHNWPDMDQSLQDDEAF